MLIVDDLRIYPVKSMRGLSVSAVAVELWGLAGDRRWMAVDAAGRFLTQREAPGLARIDVRITVAGLRLSAEGRGAVEVATPDPGSARGAFQIWRDSVEAIAADAASGEWLSDVLESPGCRLVHMADPARARPVDPAYGEAGDHVSFADAYPLLATTAESLHDLNGRLAEAAPMDRFRPNLVLSGAAAWAEDGWTRLRVGATGLSLRAVKPCDRCVVTTTDQTTGARDQDGEPLRTLGTFRRNARGRILFGQNLIPDAPGRLAVGDRVEPVG